MSIHKTHIDLGVTDSICPKHRRNLVLYFCKTCNTSGCSKCMQTEHKLHDWCDIDDIASEKQKELEKNIGILENMTLPKLLKKKMETLNGQVDKDENNICRQADAMIELINKHRQILISKIRATSKSESFASTTDLDRDITEIERIIRNSKKSIAVHAKAEIVQGNENVKVVIAEIEKSLAKIDRRTATCFIPGEIDIHALQKMFGDLNPEHDVSSDIDYLGNFSTDFAHMGISNTPLYVAMILKNTFSVGKEYVRLCAHGELALV